MNRPNLVLLYLVVALVPLGCAQKVQTIKGSIKVENVTSGSFGDHLAIYNYQLDNQYEQYQVNNELECRHLAFFNNFIVASVQTRSGGSGTLDCRISDKGITDGIVLKPVSGTHTYIKDKFKAFYPASDGLFYVIKSGDRKTYAQAKSACPATATSSLPTVRTLEKEQLVIDIAEYSFNDKIFIGVEGEYIMATSTLHWWWYDTIAAFTKPIDNVSTKFIYQVSLKKDGKYFRETNDYALDFVCTYKIFDFAWE